MHISNMVSYLLDLVQTYWQLYLKELLRLLIGLGLLKLWHLIYPMLLTEFGMPVSFKLKPYRISDQVFGLISSFLNKRQLQVALDRTFMQEYPVVAGVLHQSSILDPTRTLFLLYINVCGIGAKLGTKHVICQKLANFMYFTDQNMQRGDPVKLNFKDLEMEK